jgi:hypothetical protein
MEEDGRRPMGVKSASKHEPIYNHTRSSGDTGLTSVLSTSLEALSLVGSCLYAAVPPPSSFPATSCGRPWERVTKRLDWAIAFLECCVCIHLNDKTSPSLEAIR